MTTTTTATPVTYRKTKTGEWVAYGPAATVRPGPVTVTKRDGSTKTEHIETVGKPFLANGQQMVYGYLTPQTASRPAQRTYANHTPRPGRPGSGRCTECGRNLSAWEIRDYGDACHDCVP